MLTRAEYLRHRRRLRTLQGKIRRLAPEYRGIVQSAEDPRVPLLRALGSACDEALHTFERKGYPDDWHSWRVAGEDARYALRFIDG